MISVQLFICERLDGDLVADVQLVRLRSLFARNSIDKFQLIVRPQAIFRHVRGSFMTYILALCVRRPRRHGGVLPPGITADAVGAVDPLNALTGDGATELAKRD
jgi:hypothetical protein